VTGEQFQRHVDQCQACGLAKGLGYWQHHAFKPSDFLCDLGRHFLEALTQTYRRRFGLRRPDGPSVRDCAS
jgi:hypothetical protein